MQVLNFKSGRQDSNLRPSRPGGMRYQAAPLLLNKYFQINEIKNPHIHLNMQVLNFKSGRQDSNLRPLAPHTSALPGCATSRTTYSFGIPVIFLNLMLFKNIMVLLFCDPPATGGMRYRAAPLPELLTVLVSL